MNGGVVSSIILVIVSLILGALLTDVIKNGRDFLLYLVFKKKNENEIIGIYYGYYLTTKINNDVHLKESLWEIYPSLIKNKYYVNVYKVSDKHLEETSNLLDRKYNNGKRHLYSKEEKLKIRNLQISYKGSVFREGQHIIFKLESKKDQIETIFERRIQQKDSDDVPNSSIIIGISLAINKNKQIRANMSILSRKKLNNKNDFYTIIKSCDGQVEKKTYNMFFKA